MLLSPKGFAYNFLYIFKKFNLSNVNTLQYFPLESESLLSKCCFLRSFLNSDTDFSRFYISKFACLFWFEMSLYVKKCHQKVTLEYFHTKHFLKQILSYNELYSRTFPNNIFSHEVFHLKSHFYAGIFSYKDTLLLLCNL